MTPKKTSAIVGRKASDLKRPRTAIHDLAPCELDRAAPATARVPAPVEDPHQRPLPIALHALLPRSAFGNAPTGSEAVSPGGR